ncbi:thymidine kinase 2, mitochondrial [Cichlidogyrus casuarinus]|uniref:Thymidine kinase 2, mitochondrial n=1 Tax=Cichlidogyrus casuarinus TaxID=1844966 RepID=A0ABD2QHR6_9PLAT
MYSDPIKWAVQFQSHVFSTLLHRQLTPQCSPIRLVERSIHSSRLCFVEAMLQNKVISKSDSEMFDSFYNWTQDLKCNSVDLMIYLRSTPTTCLSRIHERNRSGEQGIALSYLEQLHSLHENWLVDKAFGELPAPLMVISTDPSLEQLRTIYNQKVVEILSNFKLDSYDYNSNRIIV